MAISNSASQEIIWGLGGPEEDHQLHHCCWTGRVGERVEEEEESTIQLLVSCYWGLIQYKTENNFSCLLYNMPEDDENACLLFE